MGHTETIGEETQPSAWNNRRWWENLRRSEHDVQVQGRGVEEPQSPAWAQDEATSPLGWVCVWVPEHPKPWRPGLVAEGLCSSRLCLYFSCLDLPCLYSLCPVCTGVVCVVSPLHHVLSGPFFKKREDAPTVAGDPRLFAGASSASLPEKGHFVNTKRK